MSKKTLIAYFSPHGNTRLVAKTIGESLNNSNYLVDFLDLGAKESHGNNSRIKIGSYDCVWVGSPIFSNHALPLVMDFISGLEKGDRTFAGVFVTYGLATSGLGLLEMGNALLYKGYTLLGAAKVPAVHSMLWRSEKPLGQGRPNDSDLALVKSLVEKVVLKLESPGLSPGLTAGDLNYQPEELLGKFSSGLKDLKKMAPPIRLDESVCTECGVCSEVCPTNNITLSPWPVFGESCVLCMNCVRNCAPGALDNDLLKVIEGRILQRRKDFAEPDETIVFV